MHKNVVDRRYRDLSSPTRPRGPLNFPSRTLCGTHHTSTRVHVHVHHARAARGARGLAADLITIMSLCMYARLIIQHDPLGARTVVHSSETLAALHYLSLHVLYFSDN